MRTAALLATVGLVTACTTSGSAEPTLDPNARSQLELFIHQDWNQVQKENADSFAVTYDAELAIALCMKAEGFEYFPQADPITAIPLDEIGARFDDAATQDPLSEDYRERYGYGHTTLRAYMTLDIPPDQNAEIRESQSPAEARAYDVAYLGPNLMDAIESADGEPVELEPDGCLGEGHAILYANTTVDDDFGSYLDIADEVQQRVQASDTFIGAAGAWTECVYEAGYEFSSPAEIKEWADRKLASIDQGTGANDFSVSDDPELVGTIDEDGLPIVSEDQADTVAGSPYTEKDLELVQDEEIRMSLELLPCDRAFEATLAPERNEIGNQLLADAGLSP
jgi:hypothetical protein